MHNIINAGSELGFHAIAKYEYEVPWAFWRECKRVLFCYDTKRS